MPKIKKLRKRKTFQYNKNRKRLRNNITSTGKIKEYVKIFILYIKY